MAARFRNVLIEAGAFRQHATRLGIVSHPCQKTPVGELGFEEIRGALRLGGLGSIPEDEGDPRQGDGEQGHDEHDAGQTLGAPLAGAGRFCQSAFRFGAPAFGFGFRFQPFLFRFPLVAFGVSAVD